MVNSVEEFFEVEINDDIVARRRIAAPGPPPNGPSAQPESVTSDLIWEKTGERHAGGSRLTLRPQAREYGNDVVVPIRLRQKPAFLGEARLMRGTRRSKKQRDFGPSLRGMMRKG
jgi:hypothetical protein